MSLEPELPPGLEDIIQIEILASTFGTCRLFLARGVDSDLNFLSIKVCTKLSTILSTL